MGTAKTSEPPAGASSGFVVVVGGRGFIGRHVIAALRRHGVDARVAGRDPHTADLTLDLSPKGHAVDDAEKSLERDAAKLRGCACVVNCVGVKFAWHRKGWRAAHVETVRTLVELMRRAAAAAASRIPLVHVSVAGLDPRFEDPYSATKLHGEAVVREAAETGAIGRSVVVRPGVVWGAGDDFSRKLAAAVKHAPVFPAPTPSGPMQIVHVDDVADVIVRAVQRAVMSTTTAASAASKDDKIPVVETVEVVGPAAVTLPELVRATAAGLDLACRPVPVPAFVLARAVAVLELLSRDPPLTSAQLTLLRRGVVGDVSQTRAWLGGREPRAYAGGDAKLKAAVADVGPLFGVSLRLSRPAALVAGGAALLAAYYALVSSSWGSF